MDGKIDTSNKFMVSGMGPQIRILRMQQTMSADDALNLAAWLVAMADREDKFPAILEAVQGA